MAGNKLIWYLHGNNQKTEKNNLFCDKKHTFQCFGDLTTMKTGIISVTSLYGALDVRAQLVRAQFLFGTIVIELTQLQIMCSF